MTGTQGGIATAAKFAKSRALLTTGDRRVGNWTRGRTEASISLFSPAHRIRGAF